MERSPKGESIRSPHFEPTDLLDGEAGGVVADGAQRLRREVEAEGPAGGGRGGTQHHTQATRSTDSAGYQLCLMEGT